MNKWRKSLELVKYFPPIVSTGCWGTECPICKSEIVKGESFVQAYDIEPFSKTSYWKTLKRVHEDCWNNPPKEAA